MPVRDEIVEIIRRACEATGSLPTEESRFDELGIDSLSFIELIVELEDSYGVCFENDELNIYGYDTVHDFINIVERHIKNKKIND